MPALTNWIKAPVNRKGSARVRLTYEVEWHSGWGGQWVGGVMVVENRCVLSQTWHRAEGDFLSVNGC